MTVGRRAARPRSTAMCPGTGPCTYYSVEAVDDESRVIADGRILLIDHDSMNENQPG